MKTMKKIEPKLIASAEDKSMPRCVQNIVNDSIRNLWHDFTDLVRFELRIKLAKP